MRRFSSSLLLGAFAALVLPSSSRAQAGPFYFSGTLRDNGGALQGEQQLTFVFDKGGAPCTSQVAAVTPDPVTGVFRVPVVLDTCAPDYFDGSTITYDIQLNGATIATQQPVGWVPYAQYAAASPQPAPVDLTPYARRSTANVYRWVRVDGNDVECDGTADAPYSTGVTSCAVATLQRAADLVPEVTTHPIIIEVREGTYYATTAGQVMLRFDHRGSVIVRKAATATGPVVISGATASNPTVSLADQGLMVLDTATVEVREITFERFYTSVYFNRVGAAYLTNVTGRNNRGHGIYARATEVNLYGAHNYDDNASFSVYVLEGMLGIDGGATVTARRNNTGVVVEDSYFSMAGTLIATSNSSVGLSCAKGSICDVGGVVDAASNVAYGLIASEHSTLSVLGTTSIASANVGILANRSSVLIIAGGILGVTGVSASTSIAILVSEMAHVTISAMNTLSITNVAWAALLSKDCSFVDHQNHAAAGVTGGSYADHGSYLFSGSFPDATVGTCILSSFCY